MLEAFGLAAPLVIAAVLVLSALAKMRSPQPSRDSFVSLRLPSWLASSVAPALLPWGELLLALALLVLPGWWNVAAATAALVLMIVYLVLIVRALGFDEPVECGCFGELGLGQVDRRTAWRNGLLVAFAATALVSSVADRRDVILRWAEAGAVSWGWLLVAVALVALVVLIVGGRPVVPKSDVSLAQDPLDYVRQPTPFAELITAAGHAVPLRELARQQAQLLIFLSLGCGSCSRTAGRIVEWQRKLGPAVGVHAVFAVQGPHDLVEEDPRVIMASQTAYYDPQHRLARLVEARGNPAAVLFGGDDLLAGGPVGGEDMVIEFVDDIRTELEMAGALGATRATGE
ncbi:MauE/DoxX family redox-associated membrane protein [Propionibacteriaceae bacterium Y1923]